jgi:ubiquitin C-terminal hydrolase
MALHAGIGPSFPVDRTLIQLVNINGTCFINSVLQILYNIPAIEDWIRVTEEAIQLYEFREKVCSMALGLFVKIYIDSVRAPQNEVLYEPTYFLDRVFEESAFHRGVQGDASEFFLWLCDSLDRGVKILNDQWGAPVFRPFSHNFLSTIAVSCWQGDVNWNKTESLLMFPFAIHDRDFLVNLSIFLGAITEDGIRIERKFTKLPSVFVVTFNQLKYDIRTQKVTKDFERFDIPDRFELADESGVKAFQLRGVSVHTGPGPRDGHFLSVFQTCNHWLIGDDAKIWGIGYFLGDFLTNGALPGFDATSPHLAMYQMV